MSSRQDAFFDWIDCLYGADVKRIAAIPGNVHTCRYFRLHFKEKTLIAVDAPFSQQKNEVYCELTKNFQSSGINVPVVLEKELKWGFFIVSDFGSKSLAKTLTVKNADAYYEKAIDALIKIHQCEVVAELNPRSLDADALFDELIAFQKWFVSAHLQITLNPDDQRLLQYSFFQLAEMAAQQPRVCCHRDFHSKHILALPANDVGVVDFYGALLGPITYDVVSLLRDVYLDWPSEQVTKWAMYFYQQAQNVGMLPLGVCEKTFMRWFDWMGLQRHMHAVATFAMKAVRDKDSSYLRLVPRALRHINYVSKQYPSLKAFNRFIEKNILIGEFV